VEKLEIQLDSSQPSPELRHWRRNEQEEARGQFKHRGSMTFLTRTRTRESSDCNKDEDGAHEHGCLGCTQKSGKYAAVAVGNNTQNIEFFENVTARQLTALSRQRPLL
jgi:hypothetical protein